MAAGTYLGRSQMGSGAAIPVTPTGQIDVNALIANMVDRKKIYYYDTYKLAPGAAFPNSPVQFFQAALGQQDPYNGNAVKTLLETNMRVSGQFSPPYDLLLNNLMFFFQPDDRLFDIVQLCKLTWFEFKILEKTMFHGSMWRNPSGMGASGFSAITGESAWGNGLSDPKAVWWFGDYKKYIPPLVNFSLTLNAPESYNTYYNSNLPANVTAASISGSALPTTLATGLGGNGIQLVCGMNGIGDGPVQ